MQKELSMKRLAITFTFALLAAACKDDGGSLESIKKEACACKDMACVESVGAKLEPYEKKFREHEPSAAEEKLGEEIEECLASAMLGGKK
jgi:hypothetical protein